MEELLTSARVSFRLPLSPFPTSLLLLGHSLCSFPAFRNSQGNHSGLQLPGNQEMGK